MHGLPDPRIVGGVAQHEDAVSLADVAGEGAAQVVQAPGNEWLHGAIIHATSPHLHGLRQLATQDLGVLCL